MGKKSTWKWVMSKNSIQQKGSPSLVGSFAKHGTEQLLAWPLTWVGLCSTGLSLVLLLYLTCLQQTLLSVPATPSLHLARKFMPCPWHMWVGDFCRISSFLPCTLTLSPPCFMLHPETWWQKLTRRLDLDAKLYFLLKLWLFYAKLHLS